MTDSGLAAVFVAGTVVSLATSWILASRVERVGSRLGASEALLGMLAALAADSPEISAAVTALAHHQQSVGTGVIIGSNVFNLAALLGLGAVVSGWIALHRRVVLLAGTVAMVVAVAALLTLLRILPAPAGLAVVLAVLAPYAVLAGLGGARLRSAGSGRVRGWLAEAVADEELELIAAVRPQRGRGLDGAVAGAAAAVVVVASVAVERAASELGHRLGVPDIVTGGLVLAAITSVPNAVAAVYLARRGRGAATLSTAFNSNALNVAVGYLVPATIVGLGPRSNHQVLVGAWHLGVTALVVVFAYLRGGLGRPVGWLILVSYAGFSGGLLAAAWGAGAPLAIALGPAFVIVGAVGLLWRRGRS